MRILFVCKRSPQQRDLLRRPYGRFFHLPTGLARLGHDVRVQLVSHNGLAGETAEMDGVRWQATDLRQLGPRKLIGEIDAAARDFSPDWVVGCSDTWCGWLAHRLARRSGARLAIDAYDNYEAYMRWNLPLHALWRRAVRHADVVTAAGPELAEKLSRSRAASSVVHVLPMAADPGFVAMDRQDCRAKLGLPDGAALFGYFGGWARNRGTDLILDAFNQVRDAQPGARLVLTGKPPAYAIASPGVINLGYLDDALMPVALNAVDVCCVIIRDSSFGRYSYPAKLCEAIACAVPVVASATEAVSGMLHADARFLAKIGDAADHAAKMRQACGIDRPSYPAHPAWPELAARLSDLLQA